MASIDATGALQRLDIGLSLPQGGRACLILALREGGVERTGVVLATVGAMVKRVGNAGDVAGPIVGVALEQRLRARDTLATRPPD